MADALREAATKARRLANGSNVDAYRESLADLGRAYLKAYPTAAALSVQGEPVAHSDKRVAAIMALVDEFAEAKRRAPLATYTADVRAEIGRSLRLPVDAAPAAPAVPQWQPIETAPKETVILLAAEFDCPGDWRIKVGYYSEEMGLWRVWGASWKPTQWMPLPAAPSAPGVKVE